MNLGTAGHIDHGKSALLSALTGRDMDRLAEERRRGITIELNFAPLDLGDGLVVGAVDVPGHEDFVHTMVAGASGIDLALLVIAADEGIMPQTEEHLLVLEELRVPAAIPVLTKRDLVEPEWLELVALEVAERLAASRVRFEAPIAVSARTGEGLAELRARLAARARAVAPRPSDDLFRMPVDRAFSVAGAGTVATGPVWSGRLTVGDRVQILPGGTEARVRSLERFGHPVDAAVPGERLAIGLAGVERADLRRGDVIVSADAGWTPTTAVDAAVSLDRRALRRLASRSRVRLLAGTAEVMARVRTARPVDPGERGVARLVLEEPLVLRGGDRFVLRSFSPVATIGGGEVLDPHPPRRAAWRAGVVETASERLVALLDRRRGGTELASVPLLLGLRPAESRALIAGDGAFVELDGHVILASTLAAVDRAIREALERHHAARPTEAGLSVETLRQLPPGGWLMAAAVDGLLARGEVTLQHGVAALAGFRPRRVASEAEIARVLTAVSDAGLAPPTVAELEAALGFSRVAAILREAAAAGRVEAIERDRYFARPALEAFEQAVRDVAAAGPLTPAALRDRIGVSRKFVIPLLEWADRRGLTERVGEARRVRSSPT